MAEAQKQLQGRTQVQTLIVPPFSLIGTCSHSLHRPFRTCEEQRVSEMQDLPIEQDSCRETSSDHTSSLVLSPDRRCFALHHTQPVPARLSRRPLTSGPASDQELCMTCLHEQPASPPLQTPPILQLHTWAAAALVELCTLPVKPQRTALQTF